MSAATDEAPTRALLLRVVGEPPTGEEYEALADALEEALPEGYNAVLVPGEPRLEALDKADVEELVRTLERAFDLEPRTNARVIDPDEEGEHGE